MPKVSNLDLVVAGKLFLGEEKEEKIKGKEHNFSPLIPCDLVFLPQKIRLERENGGFMK